MLGKLSWSESSKDEQTSSRNDDNEIHYLSSSSENKMGRKIRELHGSIQDSSYENPSFNDNIKVLKDTGKNSGLINKTFQSSLIHFDNKKSL